MVAGPTRNTGAKLVGDGAAVRQSIGVLGVFVVALPLCGLFVAYSNVSGRKDSAASGNIRTHTWFDTHPDFDTPAGTATVVEHADGGAMATLPTQTRVQRAIDAASSRCRPGFTATNVQVLCQVQ